jgi:hypothetical protein
MRDLPTGWATALAILEHSGSTVEERRDHLFVRTPYNPDFHWGHCLFVTDDGAVDDADRWVKTFQSAFPAATWIAIGLIRAPDDQDPWATRGLDLEVDDVLTTRTLPQQKPVPEGYAVRRLSGQDWALSAARSVAANDGTSEHDPQSFSDSLEARRGREGNFPNGQWGPFRRVSRRRTHR